MLNHSFKLLVLFVCLHPFFNLNAQTSVINKDGKVVSVSTGTPFNLMGTSTEANDNKSTAIERSGSIITTNGFLQARGAAYAFTLDPVDATGPRLKLGTPGTLNQFFEIGAWNNINNFDTKARDLNFFSTSAANILYLSQSNGRVGINNSTPVGRFIVDDKSYISTIPTTATNLQDNTSFRPHTRFQNTSGANNNALSLYSTTTAWGIQAHNYSTGTGLPLLLQPGGGNVGIGATTSPGYRLTVLGNARLQPNSNNNGTGEPVWIEVYGRSSVGVASPQGGLKFGWYNDYAGIEILRGPGATGAGLGFYYATTGSVYTEGARLAFDGKFGIGTSSPKSTLEVNGSATNTTAFDGGSGTTIDFTKSNLAYTSASAGAFTLNGIKDGGTYTLAVQGATSGITTFTSTGLTFKYVNNGATAANKHTLYTLLVMGTTVYVYMSTGF